MAKKPRPSLAELDEKIKKGQKELSDFEARQTARKAEGPKLDKPANSNARAPKPARVNAPHDAREILRRGLRGKSTPRPSSNWESVRTGSYQEPKLAPDGSLRSPGGRLKDPPEVRVKPGSPRPAGKPNAPHDARKIWDNALGRNKPSAGTGKPSPKAGSGLGGKLGGAAGVAGLAATFYFGDTFSSRTNNQANYGEREWLATRDRVTAMRRKTPETKGIIYGATPKLPDKTGGKSTAQKPRKQIYDRVPGSAPEAPRDDRASSGFTPSAATGPNKFESSANNPLNQARAARDQVQKAFSKMQSNSTGAAPAGSTSDSGYSKGSSKDANVGTSQMSGETKQRGSVRTLQTRYQRDSGLAMDTRKRK